MESTSGSLKNTLRERNSARLRSEILDAASQLFSTRGYASVTLDDIAAAVGVATRTIYRHFSSKDDLVLAPLRVRVHGLIEGLEQADGSEDPVALLRRLVGEAEMLATPTEFERRLRAIVISDETLLARHTADSAGIEAALARYLQRSSAVTAETQLKTHVQAGAIAGALRAAQRAAMEDGEGGAAFALALATAESIIGENSKTDSLHP